MVFRDEEYTFFRHPEFFLDYRLSTYINELLSEREFGGASTRNTPARDHALLRAYDEIIENCRELRGALNV